MPTFGARLQQLRMEKGLSQEELASRFKISKSAVGMYERDEREPSFEMIGKFAEFFGVSYNFLLGQSDEKTSTVPDRYKEFDTEVLEAFANASSDVREHFQKYLRGEVDEPIFFTEEEKRFTKDLEQGVDILDLFDRYAITIGGVTPTREELEEVIKYFKAMRIMKMM